MERSSNNNNNNNVNPPPIKRQRRLALDTQSNSSQSAQRFTTVQNRGIKHNDLIKLIIARPLSSWSLLQMNQVRIARERVFISSLNPYTTKRTLCNVPQFRACICLSLVQDNCVITSHGDHTIKISPFFRPCNSNLISNNTYYQNNNIGNTEMDLLVSNQIELVGHPRTPWLLIVHNNNPIHSNNIIIASLCLGRILMIWQVEQSSQPFMVGSQRFDLWRHQLATLPPPVSIQFYPSHPEILIVASGNRVYKWKYGEEINGEITNMIYFQSLITCKYAVKFATVINNTHLIVVSQTVDDTHPVLLEEQRKEAKSAYLRVEIYFDFIQLENTINQSSNNFTIEHLEESQQQQPLITSIPNVLATNVHLFTSTGMGVSKCGRYIALIQGGRLEASQPEEMILDTLVLPPPPTTTLVQDMLTNSSSPHLPWQRKLIIYEIDNQQCRICAESNILDENLIDGFTAIEFSPTLAHVFIGHGSASRPYYPSNSNRKIYMSIYAIDWKNANISMVKYLSAVDVDANSIAVHPSGLGVVVATRKGEVFIHDDGGEW
jgi:hypothetical protein